jgi:hypothetical protein
VTALPPTAVSTASCTSLTFTPKRLAAGHHEVDVGLPAHFKRAEMTETPKENQLPLEDAFPSTIDAAETDLPEVSESEVPEDSGEDDEVSGGEGTPSGAI